MTKYRIWLELEREDGDSTPQRQEIIGEFGDSAIAEGMFDRISDMSNGIEYPEILKSFTDNDLRWRPPRDDYGRERERIKRATRIKEK